MKPFYFLMGPADDKAPPALVIVHAAGTHDEAVQRLVSFWRLLKAAPAPERAWTLILPERVYSLD